MAKTNTQSGQSDSLVMLSFGWYAKFVLPVSAASAIASLIIESGAVKVESEHVEGISNGFLRPTKMDFTLTPLEGPFISDCPISETKRKDYLAYLKTKASVVEGYEPETYIQYLKAKGD